jgi:hypothetical protein
MYGKTTYIENYFDSKIDLMENLFGLKNHLHSKID